jgi:hypothetical protein
MNSTLTYLEAGGVEAWDQRICQYGLHALDHILKLLHTKNTYRHHLVTGVRVNT